MNTQMRSLVLLNASPKINQPSFSNWLCERATPLLGGESLSVSQVNMRDCQRMKQTEQAFAAMAAADALVLVFPLYFFCLPGLLMRFLQDFRAYLDGAGAGAKCPKVYAWINCGFPEPEVNADGLRVTERFAAAIGGAFRFGILLGGGPMATQAIDAPFMRKYAATLNAAFSAVREDVLCDSAPAPATVHLRVAFPRRLYLWMGTLGWRMMARKNGVGGKAMYRQPYLG
jgi:hypothetical protein